MGLVNSVFSLFSYSIKNNVGWLKWWVLIQCWFRGELRDQRKLLLTPTSGNITHLEQKEDRSSFTFPPRSQDGEGLLPADHQPRLFPLHTHAASDDTSSLDQLKRGTDEETGSSWCLKNTKKKQKKKPQQKTSLSCPSDVPQWSVVGGSGVDLDLQQQGHHTRFPARSPACPGGCVQVAPAEES